MANRPLRETGEVFFVRFKRGNLRLAGTKVTRNPSLADGDRGRLIQPAAIGPPRVLEFDALVSGAEWRKWSAAWKQFDVASTPPCSPFTAGKQSAPCSNRRVTHFDFNAVTNRQADEALAHLAGDVRQHLVLVVQLNAKPGAGQNGVNPAFQFNVLFDLFRTLLLPARSEIARASKGRFR